MKYLQSASLLLLSVLAISVQANPVATAGAKLHSIEAAGRNIMRMGDGGIVSSYVKAANGQTELVFATSNDNGKSWKETFITKGNALQTTVDSNFQGSYIAFIESVNGKKVGRVAYTSAPFAADRKFVLSKAVTPADVEASDTFIQASRFGWGEKGDQNAETVAYGWQDAKTKALYIGVSLDGRTFPVAQKVIDDQFATSGPSVSVRGKYVFATYLTQNPAFAPQDIPATQKVGRSYQAWTESRDGGLTWITPQPLFGTLAAAYPLAPQMPQADAKQAPTGVFLDGGTDGQIAASLAWTKPTVVAEENGVIFVQSELTVRGNEKNKVGVVSFKPAIPNGQWTHVVANNKLVASGQASAVGVSAANVVTGQFQYSALIDTPVRASVYHEVADSNQVARLVVVTSVDTGKVFDRYTSLSAADLKQYGIRHFDKSTKFETSQCLFEDRDGNVHVDLLASNGKGDLQYARIPLNVNTKVIRADEAQKVALVQ